MSINNSLNVFSSISKPENKNSNFESFVPEFKEGRENVINILKILIEQKKIQPFMQFITTIEEQNQNKMKEFIKSKYFEFVESIDNIKECKVLVKSTEEVLNELENSIQDFIKNFKIDYIERIRKKEEFKNMLKEKEKLNVSYILFAYMNKADLALRQHQFQLCIRLMNTANDKYLRRFPVTSIIYKKGEELINKFKGNIKSIIQEKLTKWLIDVNKEQSIIGNKVFKKMKIYTENNEKSGFGMNEKKDNKSAKKSLRTTKSIVDSLLLIRNTSNLNHMINKNSIAKASIVATGEINEELEYDIFYLVSNIDLKFLDEAYKIYKNVDIDTKFLDFFRSFRQGQMRDLIKIEHSKIDKDKINQSSYYESFFSEIIGFMILQVAIFELYPSFYTKRKFENSMSFLVKELQNNLSIEFETFNTTNDFINLSKSIYIFLDTIDRLGINEKIGIDIRSLLIEKVKEKVETLNTLLRNKYMMIIKDLILEDHNNNNTKLIVNNKEELEKYALQYNFDLTQNNIDINKFPIHLPYSKFVIDLNENYKKYINELFRFVKPLYKDYDSVIPNNVSIFLQQLNTPFFEFLSDLNQQINAISLSRIYNNVTYIIKSGEFYTEYVKKICNIRTIIQIFNKDRLEKVLEHYSQEIYENIKSNIEKLLQDLAVENFLPEKENDFCSEYILEIERYINFNLENFQPLSDYFITVCLKDALSYIQSFYLTIIFNENITTKYNYYFIINLKKDIQLLNKYLSGIGYKFKCDGFNDLITPLENMLVKIFDEKKFNEFITENEKFQDKINIEDCLNFLSRYKNIKNKKDLKGHITESDIKSILKQYKKTHK